MRPCLKGRANKQKQGRGCSSTLECLSSVHTALSSVSGKNYISVEHIGLFSLIIYLPPAVLGGCHSHSAYITAGSMSDRPKRNVWRTSSEARQILCHFTVGMRASSDLGLLSEPWIHPPEVPRNNCTLRVYTVLRKVQRNMWGQQMPDSALPSTRGCDWRRT